MTNCIGECPFVRRKLGEMLGVRKLGMRTSLRLKARGLDQFLGRYDVEKCKGSIDNKCPIDPDSVNSLTDRL